MKKQHEHIMIKEVYDALIEAGASDEKAVRQRWRLPRTRTDSPRSRWRAQSKRGWPSWNRRLDLLIGMAGVNLGMTAALLRSPAVDSLLGKRSGSTTLEG